MVRGEKIAIIVGVMLSMIGVLSLGIIMLIIQMQDEASVWSTREFFEVSFTQWVTPAQSAPELEATTWTVVSNECTSAYKGGPVTINKRRRFSTLEEAELFYMLEKITDDAHNKYDFELMHRTIKEKLERIR